MGAGKSLLGTKKVTDELNAQARKIVEKFKASTFPDLKHLKPVAAIRFSVMEQLHPKLISDSYSVLEKLTNDSVLSHYLLLDDNKIRGKEVRK